MITNLLDGWFQFDVGEGGFFAIFGFLFVFVGIVLLITIISILGFVITRANKSKKAKKIEKKEPPVQSAQSQPATNGVAPEVVAAITAALMAYYQHEQAKCDFVVKRIRKI